MIHAFVWWHNGLPFELSDILTFITILWIQTFGWLLVWRTSVSWVLLRIAWNSSSFSLITLRSTDLSRNRAADNIVINFGSLHHVDVVKGGFSFDVYICVRACSTEWLSSVLGHFFGESHLSISDTFFIFKGNPARLGTRSIVWCCISRCESCTKNAGIINSFDISSDQSHLWSIRIASWSLSVAHVLENFQVTFGSEGIHYKLFFRLEDGWSRKTSVIEFVVMADLYDTRRAQTVVICWTRSDFDLFLVAFYVIACDVFGSVFRHLKNFVILIIRDRCWSDLGSLFLLVPQSILLGLTNRVSRYLLFSNLCSWKNLAGSLYWTSIIEYLNSFLNIAGL